MPLFRRLSAHSSRMITFRKSLFINIDVEELSSLNPKMNLVNNSLDLTSVGLRSPSCKRLFSSSPFDRNNHTTGTISDKGKTQEKRPRRPLKVVPLKPAVDVAPKARQFFIQLLRDPPRPEICGVRLSYKQASSGEPRMVFSFEFVTPDQLDKFDEEVPLDLDSDTNQSGVEETESSTSPALFVSGSAFLKVLGATVDVDDRFLPILYDKEGNRMDPNA